MTIYRQYMIFDRGLSRSNTFYYIADREMIRCRIKISSADEVSPVDVHLRFRQRAKAPGLVHCHPVNEDTFVTEADTLHSDLPKLELVLSGVPENVAENMRAL